MTQAVLSVWMDRADKENTGDPFYSPANLRHLHHSIAQAEDGQLESHQLLEVEDE